MQLNDGQLRIVSQRRNGLILYKSYHAEFVGPGAAVGGILDLDCQQVLPVGELCLLSPKSREERQRAYALRKQWTRLIEQITNRQTPQQRAQKIIEQFKGFNFKAETINQLPDEAFALLVGVLPHTIREVRSSLMV
ncbi:MAG: hypothetical protein F6J86_06000 [Symploca sp. SIO1B1]|nr:hypothetical protein [Symploca sp. SIO1C2]NER47194.1 hypothetical protein [Symploca sp. SIO1A3]NER93374.1 hypothetical protein [Symploca sp. SIO1B1]